MTNEALDPQELPQQNRECVIDNENAVADSNDFFAITTPSKKTSDALIEEVGNWQLRQIETELEKICLSIESSNKKLEGLKKNQVIFDTQLKKVLEAQVYNVGEHARAQDQARSRLSSMLVKGFIATSVASILLTGLAAFNREQVDTQLVQNLVALLVNATGTLLGTCLGYYFGSSHRHP